MWRGTVVSIHIASTAAAPLEQVQSVRAVPGRGLEGDRYFLKEGTFSAKAGTGREVTLIESEALAALKRDYEIDLAPGDARRNIVTAGVPLNHLVGCVFKVGAATLRGMRLCEPCSHLDKLTGQKLTKALAHRGGGGRGRRCDTRGRRDRGRRKRLSAISAMRSVRSKGANPKSVSIQFPPSLLAAR